MTAISVIAIALSVGMLFLIYSNKKKPQVYVFAGMTGGAMGTALGAAICIVHSPAKRITLSPEIYNSIFRGALERYFLILLALSAVAAIVLWLTTYFAYRNSHKKSK